VFLKSSPWHGLLTKVNLRTSCADALMCHVRFNQSGSGALQYTVENSVETLRVPCVCLLRLLLNLHSLISHSLMIKSNCAIILSTIVDSFETLIDPECLSNLLRQLLLIQKDNQCLLNILIIDISLFSTEGLLHS
jgi:hypothetical protein